MRLGQYARGYSHSSKHRGGRAWEATTEHGIAMCNHASVIVGFGRIRSATHAGPIARTTAYSPDRQGSQAGIGRGEGGGRGTVNARARSSRCRRENQSSSSRCWRETPCRVRVRACGCGVSGAPWEPGSRSLFLDVAALSHAPFLAFFCRQRCAVPGFVLVAYTLRPAFL